MRPELTLPDVRPVFVVGHPRSGTTLVQLLLTAHPAFSSGPETHFFVHVLAPFDGWENGTLSPAQLEVAFKRLAGKPGIQLDEAFKATLHKQASGGGIAPAYFLHQLMRYFAQQSGKATAPRWVEKTPRHVQYVPQILTLFPHAQVINIVRDPRDVVSSPPRFYESRSAAYRRQVCVERAESWNAMVGLSKTFEADSRIMTIRYEDIIADAEGSLLRMMQFLGETYRPESLEHFADHYDQVVLPQEELRKSLLAIGEIVDRRGIWKRRMSEREARLVELICEPLMREFGYDLVVCAGLSEQDRQALLRRERAAVALSYRLYTLSCRLRELPHRSWRRLKRPRSATSRR